MVASAPGRDAFVKQQAKFMTKEFPGKGRGLVAEQYFAIGDLLLDETPLLRGQKRSALARIPWAAAAFTGMAAVQGLGLGLNAASLRGILLLALCTYMVHRLTGFVCEGLVVLLLVRQLSHADRKTFYTLWSGLPFYVPLWSEHRIFSRNAVSDDANGCVCETASMINHSCIPNAAFAWDAKLGRHQVQALQRITKGDEVVVSYVSLWQPRQARKDALVRCMGFACACHTCLHSSQDEQRLSDARRAQCAKLEQEIGEKMHNGKLKDALRDVHNMRDVAAKELGVSESLIIRCMDDEIMDMQDQLKQLDEKPDLGSTGLRER